MLKTQQLNGHKVMSKFRRYLIQCSENENYSQVSSKMFLLKHDALIKINDDLKDHVW